ncbi:morn repeat-containing protein, partial [Cystoisospora suis]
MTTSLAKREEDSPAGTQGGSYLFFLLPGYSDTFFYGVSCYRRVSAKPWYPSAGPAATVRCGVCLVGQAPFWGVFLFRLAPVACAFFQSLSRSSAYSSFFSLRSSSSLWLGDKRNDAYKKDHKI